MREMAPLKSADVQALHRVRCPDCEGFRDSVIRIRKPDFPGEGRSRYRYGVMAVRKSERSAEKIAVGPAFFLEVVRTCRRQLDHLADDEDPAQHLNDQDLPEWICLLFSCVDFNDWVGKDEAVKVSAKLLDVSPATVYSQLPKRRQSTPVGNVIHGSQSVPSNERQARPLDAMYTEKHDR